MSSFYDVILNDEEEDLQSRKNMDKWIFRLLLLLLGVMPLIVLANVEEVISPLISNVDVLSSGTKGDLFTHYKALFLLVITIIVSGMFLTKIFFMNGTVKKTFLNYVLGAFVIVIVVSTVLSPNITTALNGQYNRSEGAIIWLCYIALVFVAMNIEYPKKVITYIMYAMMPVVYINLYIMTMNFYGNDLLQKEWLQKLVSIALPEGASISANSQLLGTLNQWNYMSGMFAMMTVMYLAWAVIAKKWYESVMGVITASAAVAIMLMATSTNGFLTLVCVLPFILWLAIKSISKKRAVAVLLTFFVVMAASLHTLSLQNEKVWAESVGFFLSGNNPYSQEQPVEGALESKDELSLSIFKHKVSASDNAFELPTLPESAWGPGTGRIYIWKETLELVADRPLFGYGLDSLVYHFPHYQLEARANMNEETVVDKPHNVYVGVLFGTGIIGLLALIVFALYMCKDIFINIKKGNDVSILAILCLAFLIQALFNDTTPAIMCTFFVLAGIVLAKSNNLKKE